MESYTNTDMAVVDSCAQSYDIKIGDKKIFDDAYAKWAKKNGIQTGWNNQQHNYKSEATLEREGLESIKVTKAAKAAIDKVNKAKRKISNAKKRTTKPKSKKVS
jgi:hypothetical protein